MTDDKMDSGRRTDVKIEFNNRRDPGTGVESFSSLSVWADLGNAEIINSVEGAQLHPISNGKSTHYLVDIDPRYDPVIVAKNIEHILQTKGNLDAQR